MQAILTKYLTATDHRVARIRASTFGGSIIISYDHGVSLTQNHANAAIALATKMGLRGEIISGQTKTGYVFVFAKGDRFTV